MKDVQILVATMDNCALVRVEGRATFACAQTMRQFGEGVLEHRVRKLIVDLSQCQMMDSTFMGVLAMLGVEGRKTGIAVEILNVSDIARDLLYGLGLKNLFAFVSTEDPAEPGWEELCRGGTDADKETVLEAHEALMNVNPENVLKFKDVVEFLRADLSEDD